jgi:hypothetical protein
MALKRRIGRIAFFLLALATCLLELQSLEAASTVKVGKIEEVSAGDGTLIVSFARSPQPITIQVSALAKIRIDGREAAMGDLMTGMPVTLEINSDGTVMLLLARTVKVEPLPHSNPKRRRNAATVPRVTARSKRDAQASVQPGRVKIEGPAQQGMPRQFGGQASVQPGRVKIQGRPVVRLAAANSDMAAGRKVGGNDHVSAESPSPPPSAGTTVGGVVVCLILLGFIGMVAERLGGGKLIVVIIRAPFWWLG